MSKHEAYILAGGQSSRMGYDKGLSLLNNKLMVQHVIDVLQNMDIPIRILSSMPEYEQFGYPVVRDLFPEKGPMGGLYTALHTAKTEQILLLTCDMPLLKASFISALLDADSQASIIHFSHKNKIFPFPGRYDQIIKERVIKNLKEERLKMMMLLDQMNANSIELNQENLVYFTNINRLEELKRVERLWFGLK